MQGAPPLASPRLNRRRHWNRGGEPLARRGVPSESPTRRKTDRTAFLLAVPVAKERGDRGRGTIRRTRRRRLRWSSPPGQGEQVSLGFSPPQGTANAGSSRRGWGKPPAGHEICFLLRRLKINPVAVAFFEKPLAFLRKIWYNTIQSCTVACSCARKPARV